MTTVAGPVQSHKDVTKCNNQLLHQFLVVLLVISVDADSELKLTTAVGNW